MLFNISTLFAVKSPSYPIRYTQPDGSVISIRIFGDEFFRYTTTSDGYIIAQKADGYYYYADWDSGYLDISNNKVGEKGMAVKKRREVPGWVVENMRSTKRLQAIQSRHQYLTKAVATKTEKKAMNILIIPVQFSDLKFKVATPKKHFDDMMNLGGYNAYGATGSVKDYFDHNLKNYYDFTFTVSDVVTLTNSYSYYGENDTYGVDKRVADLIIEACRGASSQGIRFNQFDNDNTGVVDFVYVFFAGYNEAEGGGDNTVWPQQWMLGAKAIQIDGVIIDRYACSSEYMGAAGSGNLSGIGTFCHEFGHILGLQDLYDLYPDNDDGKSTALYGKLALMDEGNFNNSGRTPPNLSTVERDMLGLGNFVPLIMSNNNTIELEAIDRNYKSFILKTENEGEYFLLETREKSGWDAYIGGEGLVIYHIDKSDNVVGGTVAKQRWEINSINSIAIHQCAYPIYADPDNPDLSALFFPGSSSVRSIDIMTNPPLIDWQGKGTGIALSEITYLNGISSFRISEDINYRIPEIIDHSIVVGQRSALISWDTDVKFKSDWAVKWKKTSLVEYIEDQTTEYKYEFKNLEAGKAYEGFLYYITNNVRDVDTLEFSFTTKELTSSYPYIADIKGEYSVGDEIELNVFNISETIQKITWYINNKSHDGTNYIFKEAGDFEVRVDIQYSRDGSIEKIVKKIVVK